MNRHVRSVRLSHGREGATFGRAYDQRTQIRRLEPIKVRGDDRRRRKPDDVADEVVVAIQLRTHRDPRGCLGDPGHRVVHRHDRGISRPAQPGALRTD